MGLKRARSWDVDEGNTRPTKRVNTGETLEDPLSDALNTPVNFDELPGLRSSQLPKSRRSKYKYGQHGRKTSEQKRLKDITGTTVSGDTHESEHPIGYEALSRGVVAKRGQSSRAKDTENFAPAYQEVKPHHRANIGTGTTNTRDNSGMNSHEYRDSQRTLLEDGDAASAVQLNQLTYAHQGVFGTEGNGPDVQAADLSYTTMVDEMHEVTFTQGDDDVTQQILPIDRAEMLAARLAAKQGSWPTAPQLNAIYKHTGVSKVAK